MINEHTFKIMNRLKKFTENGHLSFKTLDAGGILENSINFNSPATREDVDKLISLGLPECFVEVYEHSDGISMFGDVFYSDDEPDNGIYIGEGAVEIFSVETVIQNYELNKKLGVGSQFVPILNIRDAGYMSVNVSRLQKQEPYLTYPGSEMSKYFTDDFDVWLEHIIMCNGNRFWEFT